MIPLILALAITVQIPPPPPSAASSIHADTLARQKARRSARVSAGRAREYTQAEAEYRRQSEAEAQYRRDLPFIQAEQRMMLERQSAAERNAVLSQMARAQQQQANAATTSAWWLWMRAR